MELYVRTNLVLVQRKRYDNDIIIFTHNRAILISVLSQNITLFCTPFSSRLFSGVFSVAGNLGVVMACRHPARASGTVLALPLHPALDHVAPGWGRAGQGRPGQMATPPPYPLVSTGQTSN